MSSVVRAAVGVAATLAAPAAAPSLPEGRTARCRRCSTAAPSAAGAAFTVDASRMAVPVYQRFGFVVCGPVTRSRGVVFVPMRRPAPPPA